MGPNIVGVLCLGHENKPARSIDRITGINLANIYVKLLLFSSEVYNLQNPSMFRKNPLCFAKNPLGFAKTLYVLQKAPIFRVTSKTSSKGWLNPLTRIDQGLIAQCSTSFNKNVLVVIRTIL